MDYSPPRAGDSGKAGCASKQTCPDDINPTQEQVTENVTISLYSLLLDLYLMTHNVTTYSGGEDVEERELVTDIVTCLKPLTWQILGYFFKHGAATGWILTYKLKAPKRQIYRSLETLRIHNLIQIKTTVKPTSKTPRGAIIWGTKVCTEDQIVEATKLYARLTSPIYLRADNLGMDFIEQVIQKRRMTQITGKDVIDYLVQRKVPGHERRDIGNMMMDLLKENGYTVWRT